ncbi:MAG: O-antigen ligase family protein, partial [Candidatus Omnitrophica bacterium]|nr:O-antigen ligase family protein [Candidatus Omnitrophota bacterium]
MAKSLLAIKLLPKRLNSLVEPVLIFILAASPLLFGSIRPFHVVVMESATALLLFTWLAVSLKKGYFQFITVPGALPVLAFIAYLFAQYVYANGLLYGVYLPGEAYRYKMKEELLKVIMYAVLFYAVLNNFFYRRRLKRLIYALVFIGFCLALLGLIQKLSGAQKIFWVSPLPEGKNRDFFSSFPSRDHFANYMNMLIFITLGFIFSRLPLLREAVKGFDKASISKGIALAFTHKIWLFTFALIIMASAVFYSLCRGAIISFFLALLFFSVLVVATGLTKRGNIVLISVIIFTAMMLVWVKAPEQINERFSKGLGTDTRFSHMIFKERRVFMDTTIEMIKTYPVFGIGTGAFEFVYDKNFKPKGFLQKNYVNHAHNDILEFISEAGLFGTAMFLLVSGFYIFFFVRIFSKRHDPLAVGVGIGASAAMLSMLLH